MDKPPPKASPYPLPELAEYLRPFRHHFYCVESYQALERYATGLLADIKRIGIECDDRSSASRIPPKG